MRLCAALAVLAFAVALNAHAPARKRLLVIGEEKGYRHEALTKQKLEGFIGIHSAAITFTDWPDYGEMIGGYYDEHPWNTFDAPIIVEDPGFPGC
ncbi:MAG: hypothetical protein ABIX28_16880 [Vicinamibacterales bacterium]